MAPPTRKRNADATRQEILETATREFVTKGFDGTRIDEIADAARVNKRMLYVYFGNKEDLYLGVLKDQLDRVLQIAAPPEQRCQNPRDEAERIIRRYFQFLIENPHFVRLVSWELLAGTRRSHRVLMERASQGLEALHQVLREGVTRGLFRPELDVRRLVLSVNAMCIGQLTHQPFAEALWDEDLSTPEAQETTLAHLLRLVFEGICVKRGDEVWEGAEKSARGTETKGARPGAASAEGAAR